MASRRQQDNIDHSTFSTTSIGRDAQAALQFLATAELENLPEHTILQRSLTVKSVISTKSSFAARYRHAASRPEAQNLVQIGIGLQAVVFEQVGNPLVMKKELAHIVSLPYNKWHVQHEHLVHCQVVAAFDKYSEAVGCVVRVPRARDLILPSDEKFWKEFLPQFPASYRQRTTIMKMERVLPLPKVIRGALVKEFYTIPDLDDEKINYIVSNIENKHCLARPYLGTEDRPFRKEMFTLRNIPLYLKRMRSLGLDVYGMAAQLGTAYALMHWGACIDGDDVEFVLGTSALPITTMAASTSEQVCPDLQHRAVGLFLIDFGQCSEVDLSEDIDVVYHRFRGAMCLGLNQDYIPHCKKTPDLFAEFGQAYVKAGNRILADKGMGSKFDLEWFLKDYQEYAEDFLAP